MAQSLPAFTDALQCDDEARLTFTWLGPSNQKEFVAWITSADSEIEFTQRIRAAIDMLAGREVIRRH